MSTTLEHVHKVIEVVKIDDGDTYWLRIDADFHLSGVFDVRLDYRDAPELHRGDAYERAQAVVATTVATEWFTQHAGNIFVQTEKIDSKEEDDFGRWKGTIWADLPDGTQEYLGDVLRSKGLASIWPTRWHEEFE